MEELIRSLLDEADLEDEYRTHIMPLAYDCEQTTEQTSRQCRKEARTIDINDCKSCDEAAKANHLRVIEIIVNACKDSVDETSWFVDRIEHINSETAAYLCGYDPMEDEPPSQMRQHVVVGRRFIER